MLQKQDNSSKLIQYAPCRKTIRKKKIRVFNKHLERL